VDQNVKQVGYNCRADRTIDSDLHSLALSLLEAAACLISVRTDGSISLSECSPAIFDVCGFTAQGLVQDPGLFWHSLDPDQALRLQSDLATASNTFHPWQSEFHYSHPTKGPVFLSCLFVPAREISGEILWHGFFRDITTCKSQEDVVRESEEKYRLLFSHMEQAVSVHEIVQDAHGKVIDYHFVDGNASLERLLGRNLDELRGKSIRILNPNVSEERFEQLGRVALTGEPLVREYHSVRLGRDYSVFSYSPKKGQFASIHTDITERKRAGQALHERHRILEALNSFSLEQVECTSQQNLDRMIARQLQEFTGAPVVCFNEYDHRKKALLVRHVHAEPSAAEWLAGILEFGLSGIKITLDDEEYASLIDFPTEYYEDLTLASGGAINAEMSQAVRDALGIGIFMVYALAIDGVLYATVAIGLKDKSHTPSEEFLKPFAHFCCISLRRTQAEAELRYLSSHDQLTDLYNRHFFEEQMRQLDTSRQLPISLIIADLNGLKVVNDTYGHLRGDELLASAAKTFKSSCRSEDVIARYGGDEFVILLPNTASEDASEICRRIAFASREISVGGVPLSLSLGLASKVREEQKLEQVLREAENTMYSNKLVESRSLRNNVLSALLKALAEKSYETEAHTKNMQEIALRVGEKLALSEFEISRLLLIITLHDIGKINMPEEILKRQGPLTPEEWKLMKTHPEVGSRIARATGEFAHVANEVLAHHERWDGQGYPQGLKGKEIPLLARITTIADAFEVMSNGRPYAPPLSHHEIIAELKNCSGKQFDPDLVSVFVDVLEGC